MVRETLNQKMAQSMQIIDAAIAKHAPSHLFGLFNGGNDSACSTHLLSRHPHFTRAVRIDTTIGIRESREHALAVAAMPWWAPLGGITGAVAVFAGLRLIEKLGAGPVNGVTICANLVASLAIDHFGLFQMQQHAVNPWRLAGAALMIGGVTLIAKF